MNIYHQMGMGAAANQMDMGVAAGQMGMGQQLAKWAWEQQLPRWTWEQLALAALMLLHRRVGRPRWCRKRMSMLMPLRSRR